MKELGLPHVCRLLLLPDVFIPLECLLQLSSWLHPRPLPLLPFCLEVSKLPFGLHDPFSDLILEALLFVPDSFCPCSCSASESVGLLGWHFPPPDVSVQPVGCSAGPRCSVWTWWLTNDLLQIALDVLASGIPDFINITGICVVTFSISKQSRVNTLLL